MISIQTLLGWVPVTGRDILDSGRLKTATVTMRSSGTAPQFGYVTVGLASQEPDIDTSWAGLCQGYISKGCHVAWTGDILLEPGTEIYITAIANVACTFTLGLITEHICHVVDPADPDAPRTDLC